MSKFEPPKNPALSYMSNTEPEKATTTEDKAVEKEIVIQYVEREPERKTRKKGLLMKPSVHDKILELAEEKGQSFNDYVNMIFEEHIKTHS